MPISLHPLSKVNLLIRWIYLLIIGMTIDWGHLGNNRWLSELITQINSLMIYLEIFWATEFNWNYWREKWAFIYLKKCHDDICAIVIYCFLAKMVIVVVEVHPNHANIGSWVQVTNSIEVEYKSPFTWVF